MKKTLIAIIVLVISLCGCKKYLNVNEDPNNPIDVQESLLLSPIETNVSDNIFSGNIDVFMQNIVQAIAPNQPNPGIWNYQMFNGDADGDWNAFYVVVLNNLNILNKKAEADGKLNYAAIAKILTAYTLATATDIWGDIPYSQAFQGIAKINPAYDKQQDIYTDVQNLLNSAIAQIDPASLFLPGTDDYFYQGDMVAWKKLAYTLKARYFMHLTKAPGHTASVQADSALLALSQGFTSNADDLKFQYAGAAGTEDNWYLVFSPITTYILNNTFIVTLQNNNDPRLPFMANKASTGLYTGRLVGDPVGDLSAYSYPTDYYAGIGTFNYLVCYTEAVFLKAEATLIKSGFAAAQPIFQAGITQHMQKLGVPSASITSYLAARGTLTAGNALQRIIEEKSTSNFLNNENFVDWRRTGFPVLAPEPGAISAIPRRLLYPESEILTNPQPQQSAKMTDRLWWDTP